MTIHESLDAWIAWISEHEFPRNTWLYAYNIQIYVRKHWWENEWWLAVANVEANPKGKGTFTDFLDHAIEVQPWAGLYMENVQNPRLLIHLIEKRKFVSVGCDGFGPPSCYLRKC